MVVGKVGRAETSTDPAPVNMSETTITFKPRDQWPKGLTKDAILARLDEKLQIPGVTNIWTQPIRNRIDMLSTGIRTQIGIKVFGPDLSVIEAEVGRDQGSRAANSRRNRSLRRAHHRLAVSGNDRRPARGGSLRPECRRCRGRD